jgi:16S rRNA G966 N2-methylase RsmD
VFEGLARSLDTSKGFLSCVYTIQTVHGKYQVQGSVRASKGMAKDKCCSKQPFSCPMESVRRGSPSFSASVTRDSRSKLHAAVEGLLPWLVDETGKACVPAVLAADVDESTHYRCRCSYQVLQNCESTGENAAAGRSKLQYAVRRKYQPVPIQAACDSSIANRRIQRAMTELLKMLNDDRTDESLGSMRENLTSVTFSSSWDERECVLSMNYFPAVVEPAQWKSQACTVLKQLNLSQISGRSKKSHLRANETDEPVCLSDTLVLCRNGAAILHPTEWSWSVKIQSSGNDHDHLKATLCSPEDRNRSAPRAFELVHYEKPESAFSHPNPYVMCRALSWILHRLEVCNSRRLPSSISAAPRNDLRLLELYCGCGAHTMAILQSSRRTIRRVVAVENDDRLIRALQRNCQLNGIQCNVQRDSPQRCRSDDEQDQAKEVDRGGASAQARLRVVAQDAGQYVKQLLRRPNPAQPDSDHRRDYDVMLLDPPKQGLDASVCDFACSHTSLQHVLYVSCGREALLRDLRRLDGHFQVVDCVLLDLFPGTSAVETLVHLRRRSA